MDVAAYVGATGRALQGIEVGAVERVIEVLERARALGRRIFIFGNGGSGAMASHFAQDLAKGTVSRFEVADNRFRFLSLTDNVPYLLALANDLGSESVFKQQMVNLAGPDDVAIRISGSGNSANVLEAIRYARNIGMVTIGLTGFDGGKLRGLVEHSVHVPSDVMEQVEDIHIVICHAIVKHFQAGSACCQAGTAAAAGLVPGGDGEPAAGPGERQ